MANLYTSDEWKSLDKIGRAQLLLVVEGLKRGTIIGGDWTSFMDILEQTGLDYSLNTNKYRLDPVVVVAKPAALQETERKYLAIPIKANSGEYHKIADWLLSYPVCCTKEYLRKRTPQEERKGRKNRILRVKFDRELANKIKKDRTYPDIFDYRPPSFTPCGIECPEATRVLTDWKAAITEYDPEAGRELVFFNRRSDPERRAHLKYLQEENQRRGLEYRLNFIRRTVECPPVYARVQLEFPGH